MRGDTAKLTCKRLFLKRRHKNRIIKNNSTQSKFEQEFDNFIMPFHTIFRLQKKSSKLGVNHVLFVLHQLRQF